MNERFYTRDEVQGMQRRAIQLCDLLAVLIADMDEKNTVAQLYLEEKIGRVLNGPNIVLHPLAEEWCAEQRIDKEPKAFYGRPRNAQYPQLTLPKLIVANTPGKFLDTLRVWYVLAPMQNGWDVK